MNESHRDFHSHRISKLSSRSSSTKLFPTAPILITSFRDASSPFASTQNEFEQLNRTWTSMNQRPFDHLDTYLRMSGRLYRAIRPTTASTSSADLLSIRIESYKVFTADGTFSYVSELIFSPLTWVDLGEYLCLNFGHTFTFQSAFLSTFQGKKN